jgi:hypothetical protein
MDDRPSPPSGQKTDENDRRNGEVVQGRCHVMRSDRWNDRRIRRFSA